MPTPPKRQFSNPDPSSPAEWERTLHHGDNDAVCRALVGLALNHDDGGFVEAACLAALKRESDAVRGVACTCLGHVARIHGKLSERALETLRLLAVDPAIGGQAEDALQDVEIFITRERIRKRRR